MQQITKLLIGVVFLALGIPIGNFLAKVTKEELKSGKKWFKLIILICFFGGFWGLISQNDVLMFTMFFIAIVTSQSLRK